MNQSQVLAIGRHVATASVTVATTLGAVQLLTPEQVQSAVAGVNQISEGVAKLAVVLGPIAGLLVAWFSQHSAKPSSQLAAVAANPAVQAVIMTTSAAAAEQPSDKVIAPPGT